MVNATGVWADRLRPEELHDEAEVPVIRPSRGTHVIAAARPAAGGRGRDRARRRRPHDLRAAVARADADRHDRQRLRGRRSTTCAPSDGRRRATCSTRSTRSSAPTLGPADLAGAYAGVRPLISTGDPKKSVDISRKAELYETSSGMVTITGGKLTTWRRMAKMTVDRIVERDGRDAPCRTHEIPLGMAGRRRRPAARRPASPEDAYEQLAGRYGYAAHEVLRAGRRARASSPAPIVAGDARPARRGRVRRAPRAGPHASATCCCAAPGSG